MIKKFFIAFLASTALLTSCSNDDDGIKEPNVETQNDLDDKAIKEYLADHYFHPLNGKPTAFDDIEGNDDDQYRRLEQDAKQIDGVWYVKNPDVAENAEGSVIKSNDESKILISYDLKTFKANTEAKKTYGALGTYGSSINLNDGSGVYDPSFYYVEIPAEQYKAGIRREHIEIKNLEKGLKQFKSTGTNHKDLYHFQGVVIIPSRLAFGREKAFTGTSLSDRYLRDISFILSFELHQVEDRKPASTK